VEPSVKVSNCVACDPLSLTAADPFSFQFYCDINYDPFLVMQDEELVYGGSLIPRPT
jgi:hypothetical protein